MKRKEIDAIKSEAARLLQRIDDMERCAELSTPKGVTRTPG